MGFAYVTRAFSIQTSASIHPIDVSARTVRQPSSSAIWMGCPATSTEKNSSTAAEA